MGLLLGGERVVVVTGNAHAQQVRETLSMGPGYYIVKAGPPFNMKWSIHMENIEWFIICHYEAHACSMNLLMASHLTCSIL